MTVWSVVHRSLAEVARGSGMVGLGLFVGSSTVGGRGGVVCEAQLLSDDTVEHCPWDLDWWQEKRRWESAKEKGQKVMGNGGREASETTRGLTLQRIEGCILESLGRRGRARRGRAVGEGSETRAEEALAMTMLASSVAEEAAATIATEAEEAGSATAEAEEARRQSPPDPDGSRIKTLDPLRTSRPWVAERTARMSVFWRPISHRWRLCYRLLLLEHICA